MSHSTNRQRGVLPLGAREERVSRTPRLRQAPLTPNAVWESGLPRTGQFAHASAGRLSHIARFFQRGDRIGLGSGEGIATHRSIRSRQRNFAERMRRYVAVRRGKIATHRAIRSHFRRRAIAHRPICSGSQPRFERTRRYVAIREAARRRGVSELGDMWRFRGVLPSIMKESSERVDVSSRIRRGA